MLQFNEAQKKEFDNYAKEGVVLARPSVRVLPKSDVEKQEELDDFYHTRPRKNVAHLQVVSIDPTKRLVPHVTAKHKREFAAMMAVMSTYLHDFKDSADPYPHPFRAVIKQYMDKIEEHDAKENVAIARCRRQKADASAASDAAFAQLVVRACGIFQSAPDALPIPQSYYDEKWSELCALEPDVKHLQTINVFGRSLISYSIVEPVEKAESPFNPSLRNIVGSVERAHEQEMRINEEKRREAEEKRRVVGLKLDDLRERRRVVGREGETSRQSEKGNNAGTRGARVAARGHAGPW